MKLTKVISFESFTLDSIDTGYNTSWSVTFAVDAEMTFNASCFFLTTK